MGRRVAELPHSDLPLAELPVAWPEAADEQLPKRMAARAFVRFKLRGMVN